MHTFSFRLLYDLNASIHVVLFEPVLTTISLLAFWASKKLEPKKPEPESHCGCWFAVLLIILAIGLILVLRL